MRLPDGAISSGSRPKIEKERKSSGEFSGRIIWPSHLAESSGKIDKPPTVRAKKRKINTNPPPNPSMKRCGTQIALKLVRNCSGDACMGTCVRTCREIYRDL